MASNASPVGFVHQLALKIGAETEISRAEFFEHGVKEATSWEETVAGSARDVADILERRFEATGSRGGFMLGHITSLPRDLETIADLLVPELQRRGRFRTEYRYKLLRENLLDS